MKWAQVATMKIDVGLEGILRIHPSNLKVCNVGITDGRGL
jgi:hypothetical protein